MPTRYDLTVAERHTLTPHMLRVVLTGPSLEDFPQDQASAYVKVAVPAADGTLVRRSYTVRHHDVRQRRLTLDFLDHGDDGPASRWVRRARTGDPLAVYGPGARKLVDPHADWVLLGGDMTALPAISVNLEQLPDHAKGYAVIEVPDAADRQALNAPPGVELIWVIDPDPAPPNGKLVDTIRALEWLPGTPYPWFAGEFDGMRRMREYLRTERGLDRGNMYLSCYWKAGESDEGLKRAKRLDAERESGALAG